MLTRNSIFDLDLFDMLFASDPFAERDDGINLKSKVDDGDKGFTFTIEVPGFDENEINIEVKDRSLEVVAEHKEDSEGKYFHRRVNRAWTLPKSVKEDEVTAVLKNGVLTVQVPKKELAEPKKVKLLKE